MPLTLEKKIVAGFSAAVGFMLIIGGAAWWSAVRSAGTFQQVDHTYRVLDQLEAGLTDMLNMQTATRGYLLTGDPQFLDPYKLGSARIEPALRALRGLTADNPRQAERLDRLESAMAGATAIMRELIARRGTTGSADGLVETLLAGKKFSDQVRQVVAEMVAEERRRLSERSARAGFEQRRAVVVFGFGSLLGITLVATAGLLVRRDFHQRVRAEAALRTSEAEYRTLFESMDEGFCVIEVLFDGGGRATDYRFLRLNPAFAKHTGMAGAQGRTMRELAPALEAFWFETFGHIALTGEPARFQNRAAELHRWFDVYAFRYGDPIHRQVAIMFRDITERKQQEEQIRRLNADLQQRATLLEATNQELEAFSYSVSHDLRAPLRHIDGFASLLQKNSADRLDELGRRHLATISASARQMGRLIDDLLSFSRMGRAAIQPRGLEDHNALVASVIQEGRWERPDRPIAWQIAALPPVRADRAMLHQVWTNLLDNAVKYSGKVSAPRIEIGGQTDPATGEQVFFVRDNGAGFDMRYADKLFGVFQRLHGPAEFEGTGIGLANVRRIILRHGGRTWAEGAVDRGATFYFSLPANPTPAAS